MSHDATKITRSEWRWAWCVAVLVVAATFIPALFAVTHVPAGKVFLWTNELSARDLYTYIAWMDQSARGHVLTMNPFTTEPHGRLLFRPFLVLGGWLSRVPGLSPIGAWELLRFAAGVMLLLLVYRWIALYLARPFERRLAYLVTALSGGLGWLLPPALVNSTDRWVPESITFLALYQSPHFAASMALMLVAMIGFHRALADGKARRVLPGGVAVFFLAWIHPFDIVTVFAVLAAHAALVAWRSPRLMGVAVRAWITLALFVAPVAAWQAFLLGREPVYALWTKSIHGASPGPLAWLAGFGLLVPLAVYGAPRIVGGRSGPGGKGRAGRGKPGRAPEERALATAPVVWVIVAAVLIYLPFDFQRRLIQGAHVPLALLAAGGAARLLDRAAFARRGGRRSAVAALIVLLLVPSNVERLRLDIAAYAAGGAPNFLGREYLDAFRWLREKTDPGDAVLSSIQTGHFIPAFAGNRAFLGHGELTVGSHQKADQAALFFRGGMDRATARSFLDYTGAAYIFVSPAERALGAAWIESWPDARPVYENRLVTIYAVPPKRPPAYR